MEKKIKKQKIESVLVLHNIRSVLNVGAMFRTADAIGVSRIILSGYSPTPIDRFGRMRSDFSKASLGSEKTMIWEYVITISPTLKKLKQEGFEIIGVEQDARSVDYKEITLNPNNKVAIVMGTETTGIDSEILKQCDIITEIPMKGMKESLNVSVAAGIILYRLLDQ